MMIIILIEIAVFAHRAVNTLRCLPPRPLVQSQQSSHLTAHPQCVIITYTVKTFYATASDEHYRACRYTDGGLVLARERVMYFARRDLVMLRAPRRAYKLPLREPGTPKINARRGASGKSANCSTSAPLLSHTRQSLA